MSLESDPNIEKLLAAYAKERREKAGAPLELSSAQRQRMQREIERKFGEKNDAAGAFGAFWRRFWPRIALAGGAAAILLFFVVLHEKSPQKTAVFAKNERVADVSKVKAVSEQKPGADQADRLLGKNTESLVADAKTPTITVAPGTPVPASRMPMNAPTEASKMEANGNNILAYDKDSSRPRGFAGKESKAATNSGLVSSVSGGLAVNGFVFADRDISNTASSTLSTSYLAFSDEWKSLDAGARDRVFKSNLASPSRLKVLVDFDVEREGEKVRIVDSDGSVYSGTLAKAETTGSFTVSVSGTNVTLNQSVAFTGTFYPGAEARVKTRMAIVGAEAKTKTRMRAEKTPTGALGSIKAQKARISGRVQVGGTTGFLVEANEAEP